MTWRLTLARADASRRLRIGRLGLDGAQDKTMRELWPSRWDHNLVVLRPERTPAPSPVPPVVLTAHGRLQLPTALCAHLDAARQPVLVACNGRELWLVKTTYVAAELLTRRQRKD